jgi:hypothetical protein
MNLKLHLAVIGVMTVALVGGYSLLQKSPETASSKTVVGDRYIRIIHAHWGLNCNRQIQETAAITASQAESANPLLKTKPKLVEPNNALTLMREQCERHMDCSVPLRSVTLGNPMKNCVKELDIGWRCFSYDKLQTQRLSEGQTLSIRCD